MMYKTIFVLIALLYPSHCFAEYYEIGGYLISIEHQCEKDHIDCNYITITILNEFNCYSEQVIGNAISYPDTFNMHGYTFQINTVKHILYTHNDITLDLYTDQGILLSSLKDGILLSEQQFQKRKQLCK